ncbi:MAG: glycosyltransferase family A protein [Myxococcota bacterium]
MTPAQILQQYLHKQPQYTFPTVPKPAPDLSIVVVIPCHNEPNLTCVLDALRKSPPPSSAAEVWLILNASEQTSASVLEQHRVNQQQLQQWKTQYQQNTSFSVYWSIHHDLPRKHAGVGLARKIGMDHACARLLQAQQETGILVCLDADCIVAPSYWKAIEQALAQHPKTNALSIHYEHPIHHPQHVDTFWQNPETPHAERETLRSDLAIVLYELFLRYYVHLQSWAGLPFAFQTVGSAMAVSAQTYAKVGGMNKRKAGEDFYFLQKCIQYGGCHALHTTTVYPSARTSNRVPFGTGRAMHEILQHDSSPSYTGYDLQSFQILKDWLAQRDSWYTSTHQQLQTQFQTWPHLLQHFLRHVRFLDKISEIQRNVGSIYHFEKRFWTWWDAFMTMKWAHYARDQAFPNPHIVQAVQHFLEAAHGVRHIHTPWLQLQWFRHQDRRDSQ